MENWQAVVSLLTLVAIVVVFTTEWFDITIATFLGALFLIFTNVISLREAIDYIARSDDTLALLFGFMVLVRAWEQTGIFEYFATKIFLFTKGEGKRLLLTIVGITSLTSAFLPNAIAVIILAPLMPELARQLTVNLAPLLILLVLVANSAGLLTIFGDRATFIVADGINLNFTDYLWQVGLGGLFAVGTITVMLPFLWKKIWKTKIEDFDRQRLPQIHARNFLNSSGLIILGIGIFFIFTQLLNYDVSPTIYVLFTAALVVLSSHQNRMNLVNSIFQDIDWSILIFFVSIFVVVGGLEQAGVVNGLSRIIAAIFGTNIIFGLLILLFCCGIISTVIPSLPLVVAMLPLLKEYIVSVGLATSSFLSSNFQGQLSVEALLLFYAMLFGVTLGGNGTAVGGISNVIAVNYSERERSRISLKDFLHYGIPVMLLQLVAIALYLLVRFII